jgi:hypothetical protein
MRFEVIAAYVMGIALPVLEVIRRRTNFDDIPAYVDDFIIGAFLLYAARAVALQKPNGRVLLVAAWAALCGGLYGSFFGQLQGSSDVSGFSNGLVVLIKGVLYLVAIGSLIMAVRSATPEKHG